MEAFKRTLGECVADQDLPMEPSDLLKYHFQQYHMTDGAIIDLSKSSYKKIGKLLDKTAISGLIKYEPLRGKDHKVITRINREKLA